VSRYFSMNLLFRLLGQWMVGFHHHPSGGVEDQGAGEDPLHLGGVVEG
jgi:hypothetical protein